MPQLYNPSITKTVWFLPASRRTRALGEEVGHQHLQNQLQSHHWHQLQGSNFLLSGKVVHTTLQQHQPENIGQINNEIKFSGESNTLLHVECPHKRLYNVHWAAEF